MVNSLYPFSPLTAYPDIASCTTSFSEPIKQLPLQLDRTPTAELLDSGSPVVRPAPGKYHHRPLWVWREIAVPSNLGNPALPCKRRTARWQTSRPQAKTHGL